MNEISINLTVLGSRKPSLIHKMPYVFYRLYPPFLQLENHLVSRHKSPAIIHLRMPISHSYNTTFDFIELLKQIEALLYHVLQQVQICLHNPDMPFRTSLDLNL